MRSWFLAGKRAVAARSASSWRPAAFVVARAEAFLENLRGRNAGHDDHRTEGHVLENHCQSLIVAIPGHTLGL